MKKSIEMLNESWESEKLQKLIDKKVKELKMKKPDWVKKDLQNEVLLLTNEILPIVLKSTTILYSEIVKHLVSKIHEAVGREANAIVMVIPLHQTNDEWLKVATVNPNRDNPLEGLEISLEAYGRKLEEVSL